MLVNNPKGQATFIRPTPSLLSDFDFAPWRFSGQVFGCLLNSNEALAALGEAQHQPPYKSPPRAPVLYFKPRHTHLADGAAPQIATGAEGMSVGASLGLLIGRPCRRVRAEDALDHVAGYAAVADLFIPHTDFYRPSVRLRARDASLAVGRPSPRAAIADPDALSLSISIDGQEVCQTRTAGMQRSAAQLLADVSEFMSLQPGDLLLLGSPPQPPLLRPGQRARISIAGLAALDLAAAVREVQP